MSAHARFREDRGQSLVEILGLVPVVALCGLLAMQALVVGANYVAVDAAVHAGAIAAQTGGDVKASVGAAIPGWSRGRVTTVERGAQIDVTLRPRAVIPGLAQLLTVRASARTVNGVGDG